MLRTIIFSAVTFIATSNMLMADIGFDRIVANQTGRCWRVMNRDFDDVHHFHSGIAFKVIGVEGNGQTDDMLTYSLTYKEDFYKGQGWDESKTKTFTGTGLIKSRQNGRINFELYVTVADGTQVTLQGYYHPGENASDQDDRMMLQLPPGPVLLFPIETNASLGEGSTVGF